MALPAYDVIQQPKRRSHTLVLVPVYNEMPHLGRVIETIRSCWWGDILAVDDNSADLSLALLRRFPSLHILHNRRNAGAGGVLLQGFAHARRLRYRNVITLDADGQHSPLCIRDFLREIEPHMAGTCRCSPKTDFVWGSRYLQGHRRLRPAFQIRQEVNRIVTRRLNDLTGYGLTDAFCGFRAYRLAALRKLRIDETGYGMFMEMTVRAARTGLSVCEIPVPLIYLDETRNFQHNFSNTRQRLAYYLSVIDRTAADAS